MSTATNSPSLASETSAQDHAEPTPQPPPEGNLMSFGVGDNKSMAEFFGWQQDHPWVLSAPANSSSQAADQAHAESEDGILSLFDMDDFEYELGFLEEFFDQGFPGLSTPANSSSQDAQIISGQAHAESNTPQLSVATVQNSGPSDRQGKTDIIDLCNSDDEQTPKGKMGVPFYDFLKVQTDGTGRRKSSMNTENGTTSHLHRHNTHYDDRQRQPTQGLEQSTSWNWPTPSPMTAFVRLGLGGNDNNHNALLDVVMNPTAEAIDLPLSLFKGITGKFSDEHIIGRGGFGVVYKGVLQNKQKVAVKRLQAHTIDDTRFHTEVNFMKKLKHKNIVRFLGYCVHTEKIEYTKDNGEKIEAEIRERLLCFEYVPHGTIKEHIADESCGLEWPKRFQIIKEICDGLDYIHNVERIVHLDIKPDNILLDDNIVPKIADFGLSRLIDDYSKRTTKNKPGSLGYMAPEYMFYGKISRKADIFGLGRTIFELVTGSKGPETHEKDNFLEKVLTSWSKVLSTSHSGDSFTLAVNQVKTCINIALHCTEDNRDNRLDINDITRALRMVQLGDDTAEDMDVEYM